MQMMFKFLCMFQIILENLKEKHIYQSVVLHHLLMMAEKAGIYLIKFFSSNWWWITLIVIFGVAAIGAGGWFAY